MRKGMLFFSQYRTLRRIFLKNLKKYLRFVGPYRPGAFFLQDGVLRPTVWPLLCSDECGPGSGGIGSVGPGGPVPPQIPAGRYVRPMRRNTARRSRTRILPSGPAAVLPGRVYAVFPGRVYVADLCWFAGTDARCFARQDLRCFAGWMHAVLPERTLTVLSDRDGFRNISYLCPGSRPVFLAPHPLRCAPAECPQRCVPGMMPLGPA